MLFPYVLEAGWPGGTVAQTRDKFLGHLVPGLGDPEYLALLEPETLTLRLLVDVKGLGPYAPRRGAPQVKRATLYPSDRILRIYHALQATVAPDGTEKVTGQVLIIEVARAGGTVQVIGLALDTDAHLEVVTLDGRPDAVQAQQ